jgi:uncharacterized protein YciI
MSAYAVIREAGPGWTDGGIADQPAVADHAAFMNDLADQGFLLFAGPLAGSEGGRVRALIVDAHSEDEIRNRLADDPWVHSDRLRFPGVVRRSVTGRRASVPARSARAGCSAIRLEAARTDRCLIRTSATARFICCRRWLVGPSL